MSVTAAICLETETGYDVITVDIDGNPAFCGAILYAKYQTEEKVRKLLKLGDLQELHEKIRPVPSLGHYILKEGKRVKEVRLQEGVCVSKKRDIRQIKNNIIKKCYTVTKARSYKCNNPYIVWINEGVDCLYLFNPKLERWTTYAKEIRSGKFKEIKVNYPMLIKNLLYRDDISELTEEEKQRLSYTKNWRCDE